LNETHHPESSSGNPAFSTTRWTLVMRARGDAPEASAALGELCEAYWTPVLRFLRREGRNEDQSRELTQEFFSRLLSRGGVDKADPARGRFRSYLLGALKHFLADVRRSQGRQKRGGDAVVESIDSSGDIGTSAGRQIPDPTAVIPDTYFDHQWALAVIDRALGAVQSDFEAASKETHFEALKPWLIGDTENLSQTEAAAQLGITAGAVKVAIHRLRKNFRDAVQSEIAQTVNSPAEIAEELRYLIEVLS
jgi:RNA polymerase sigma factor (sigma-70 family)